MKDIEKNNYIKNFEENLPYFNLEQLESLTILIKKQILKNKLEFERSISLGDIENIETYIAKISFDKEYVHSLATKKLLHPNVNSIKFIYYNENKIEKLENTNIEFCDEIQKRYFFNIHKQHLKLGTLKEFLSSCNVDNTPTFKLKDLLVSSMIKALNVSFTYYGKNLYSSYVFLKSILKHDPELWDNTLQNFFVNTLKSVDYKKDSLFISALLKDGHTNILINKAKIEENYLYLKSIINIDNFYSDVLMVNSLKEFHLPVIKECFENGFPFFKEDETLTKEEKNNYKNAFSQVFSSKESLELQEYIIENIPDISVGKHIIVKTILNSLEKEDLHNSKIAYRTELIKKIAIRYIELNRCEIDSLEEVLEKRKDSAGKDLLNKAFTYYDLKENIKEKENFKITRYKI